MQNQENALAVLREFLSLEHCSSAVLEKFAQLPGARSRRLGDRRDYVYIPSTRPSPVLLVAHADVDVDLHQTPVLIEDAVKISNTKDLLGADDRAGCAIIWLLRNLGHGILITDGEEDGCLAIEALKVENQPLVEELNSCYQFMVEFDRAGRQQFKCYDVGTDEFRQYVQQMTGFQEPDRKCGTDIRHLAQKICGVNISCGYGNAHHFDEYIVKDDWLYDLQVAENWLSAKELPKFTLA